MNAGKKHFFIKSTISKANPIHYSLFMAKNTVYCILNFNMTYLEILDIQIRIRGSVPLTTGSGPVSDPALFINGFQDANKKYIFCLSLFEGTFTSVFKDKKSYRRYKSRVEIKFFFYFFA
jgi:hypothetical protein